MNVESHYTCAICPFTIATYELWVTTAEGVDGELSNSKQLVVLAVVMVLPAVDVVLTRRLATRSTVLSVGGTRSAFGLRARGATRRRKYGRSKVTTAVRVCLHLGVSGPQDNAVNDRERLYLKRKWVTESDPTREKLQPT